MGVQIFTGNHRGQNVTITQSPDLRCLVDLEKASWPKNLQASKEELGERLRAFPEGIFILSVGKRDVAQVTISPKQMPEDIQGFEQMRDLPVATESEDLWVTNISVRGDADLRGKGYGSKILTEVVTWAKKEGYKRILAGVTLDGLKEALDVGEVSSAEEYAKQNPPLRVFQRAAENNGCSHEHTGPLEDYWLDDEGSLGYGDLVTIIL